MTKARANQKVAASANRVNAYRLWKPLLVLAVLVPVAAILYFWSQTGFAVPMTVTVLDEVTANVAVSAAFLGLVALSFAVQYYYGPSKTRRSDVRARTPILVLLGLGVGLIALVLRWWINSSSTRDIVSYIAHKPLVSGSAAALVIGGLVVAFVLSPREEQRRVLRGALFFIAAFLTFGGPTYLIYGLQNVGVPYSVLVLGGLIAFVLGVLLLLRLIRKQTKL